MKISVITPSCNQAAYIERTILSVASQEVDAEVEHRIVDGGSVDDTLEILQRHAARLKVTSGKDQGMSDALNIGFSTTSGDIIGWLNSDDLYLPGTLQKVANYFQDHPECQWLYGQCRMIGEDDRETRRWITAYKNRKLFPFRYDRLLVENFISQPAVFFRRSLLERVGQVDITLPTAMDYDLWLRMAAVAKPDVLRQDLACFRVHRKSISAAKFREQFEEQYIIHRRYDRRWWLLFRHRAMITGIVSVYSVINLYFCLKDHLWVKKNKEKSRKAPQPRK